MADKSDSKAGDHEKQTLQVVRQQLSTIDPKFKNLTDTKVEQILQVASVIQTYRSGPLPDPEDLRQYENILPGSSERFFTQWESQTKERQSNDRIFLRRAFNQSGVGLWVALAVTMMGIGSAIYLAMSGHDAVAIAVGGPIGLSGLASAFIVGRRKKS